MVELPIDNSNAKNISFGIEGIFLGLLLFILVLLGLNYFRIISLSFLHPMLSILPQKSISTNNTSVQLGSSETVEEKAEKAGYKIAWKGSTEDGSGRAILASEERTINGWVDKFGWQQTNLGNGEMADYRGQGIFERWEKILGTDDYYIILLNPVNKNTIKARIVIDKNTLEKYTPGNDAADNRTRLEVEDLSYGSNLDKDIIYKRIGFFYSLTEDDIDEIIKKGDMVTVANNYHRQQVNNEKVYSILKDSESIPLAVSIILRKFNIN